MTLVAIVLLAAALRVAYHQQLSETLGFAQPLVDAKDYDRMARGVLDGSWPEKRVFFVDPLYAYLLAGQYALFGTDAADVFVTQHVLGVLGVVLLYLIAASFLRPSEALVAGVLAALYGVFFFFEALVLKTSLAVVALSAILFALVRARNHGLGWSLLAGLLLGAAALLRGNLLLLAPVAFVWLLWTSVDAGGLWNRLRRPLLLTLGTLAALAPATLHNLAAGDLVLTTSNLGANLYTGNGPHNDSGSYVPPPGVRASPLYEELDFRRLAEDDVGRLLSPSEVSRWWVDRTLAEARADPARVRALLAKKLLLFLNATEVPDNESYAKTREEVALLRLPLPCYGTLLILAAAACVLVRWRPEHVLALSVVATVGLTVVVFFVNARFRLTAVPGLILLAAALPGALCEGLARGAWLRGALAAALAAGALFVTTRDVYDMSATMLYYNDAVLALDAGDRAGALGHLERALEEDGANWRAHLLLGSTLAEDGRTDDARAALVGATRLAPKEPEAFFELGRFLATQGELEPAATAFARAVQLDFQHDAAVVQLADVERRLRRHDAARARLEALLVRRPRMAQAWYALGLVEQDSRAFDAAAGAFGRAVAERPQQLRFRLALGRALRLAGRLDEAREAYDAALELDPENAEARGARAALGD